jgi:Leucine-rich repeat (LRR) protein
MIVFKVFLKKLFSFLMIFGLTTLNFMLISQCDRTRDSLALVRLFNETDGSDWTNKTNWLISGFPLNTWYGVVVNAEGCVTELNLNSNKLRGPLPDEITQLRQIIKLQLNDNNLTIGNNTDSLPVGLSQLENLEVLNLSSNLFGGPLNVEIGQLSKLKILNLSINYFTGKIPTSFGNLKNVTKILLNQNAISGSLPSNIGSMENLEELILSQNKITGSIPVSIGNLSKLKILSISQNLISGVIPPEIGQLTGLQFLYMNENRITGSIPSTIGNLTKLRELWLNDNQISGVIPVETANLADLRRIVANNNQLSGSFPDVLTTLQQLTTLIFSYNQMTGDLPSGLTNLINLENLLLNHNFFTGSLPDDMGKLTKLQNFQCQNNNLTGTLPSTLGNILSLRRIYFHNNAFFGCFPPSYRNFCATLFNENTNENGHNFSGNNNLIFDGDFLLWCILDYKPNATFTTNAPLCEGNTLLLQPVDQTLRYQWSGPNSFSSTDKSPSILDFTTIHAGIYILTVTDSEGCTATSSAEAALISTGNIQVNTPVCEGKTIQFTISEGLSYIWEGPGNFTSTERNPSIPSATKDMEGLYKVQIFTSDCVIEKEIVVELTTIGSVKQPDPVCLGNSLTLEAQGGNTYSWSGPSGFSGASGMILIPNIQLTNSGMYTVVIRDNTGCRSEYNVEVVVVQPEVPVLDDQGVICKEDDLIKLSTEQNGISGSWSGKGVEIKDGEYFFNPSAQSGFTELIFSPGPSFLCVSEAKTQIFVHQLSVRGIELSPNTSETDDNGAFTIQVNGSGNKFMVMWQGPVSGTAETTVVGNIDVNQIPSGTYALVLTNDIGCKSEDTVKVQNFYSEYFLPNVVRKQSISAENSFFTVYGKNISAYDLDVYDRWGNLSFSGKNLSANDYQNGWNLSGSSLQSGVYMLSVRLYLPAGNKTIFESLTILE